MSGNIVVQVFGVRNSPSTRAAERFFKERRIVIQMVDLRIKPMSPGEIRRFVDRYTLRGLCDTGGKAWIDAGLQYMKLSDAELIAKIEREPKLLRLPLVRAGNKLAIGEDEAAWKIVAAG
ncbi:MAG: arsenate reductase [Acidobacteriota bacterium]|nr:arsenate reductase [Acidobacteriota bacterium]